MGWQQRVFQICILNTFFKIPHKQIGKVHLHFRLSELWVTRQEYEQKKESVEDRPTRR